MEYGRPCTPSDHYGLLMTVALDAARAAEQQAAARELHALVRRPSHRLRILLTGDHPRHHRLYRKRLKKRRKRTRSALNALRKQKLLCSFPPIVGSRKKLELRNKKQKRQLSEWRRRVCGEPRVYKSSRW